MESGTDVGQVQHYLPDIVDDLMGRLYYIVVPDSYVPQEAALLSILFCLSMVARYYPDVWMDRIDHDATTAELLDSFLNLAHRKFPNLVLDQLTDTKHHIHS
jgi:hypothetical protein